MLIPLKYGSDCRACGIELKKGIRALWSPSFRNVVWCQGCVLALSAPRDLDAQTDIPQERWARLCRYLAKSVLAEMADTLVSFRDSDGWCLHHARSDVLVTGDDDRTPVPKRLGSRLDAAGHNASFIYGWPALIAMSRQRRPMIAPLFVVPVRPERRDDEWIGYAESEPEFNLSIVAGELFDLSMKDEIDAVVGDAVPFGDAPALVRMARMIAQLNLSPPPFLAMIPRKSPSNVSGAKR